MIISHSLKFIIVDIPKTGTTAILSTLRNSYIDLDIIGTRVTDKYYQHDTASNIKRKLLNDGYNWDNYYSYTRIRNPWERYISYFLWTKKIVKKVSDNSEKINPLTLLVYNSIIQTYQQCNNCDNTILEYYINILEKQSTFFLDNNKNIVSHIGRFENLQQDFEIFCKNVGMRGLKLRHRNQNKSYNYRDFYNQELIDKVATKEKYIIDKWGYEY